MLLNVWCWGYISGNKKTKSLPSWTSQSPISCEIGAITAFRVMSEAAQIRSNNKMCS